MGKHMITAAQAFRTLGRLHQRLFAWFMDQVDERYEELVRERKRRLLGALEGTIVELGPGTGPNLRYLDDDVHWIGIEPNPYMDPYLLEEVQRPRRLHVIRGRAESLCFPDASVDAVLSTLVLCSVDGLEASLREIHRVLKPGGRFVFIEHVGAPSGSWLRRLQRWIRPAWKCVGDGCRPDRETGRHIRAAGFRRLELESFRLPLPVVSPHVSGIAWK